MKRIIILGGGTFEPIRNHLSLAAPAFGTTAKKLHELIPSSQLILTKMADSNSDIISNADLEECVNKLLKDRTVGTIILNTAICDYKPAAVDGIQNGFHAERLRTKNGDVDLTIVPTEKIISKIRRKRPDIFLVGFKTTTFKSSKKQFLLGLKMMKESKCNLVLANDTVTRNNMIITPEETVYGETLNRDEALKDLVEMIQMRNHLTYTNTVFDECKSVSITKTPSMFQDIIAYLIANGGFIENNGNGFTPGHFCYAFDPNTFLSSQRKADHNKVFEEGMSLVQVTGEEFKVSGRRKASVGARSQWMMLQSYPEYNCIIHTHNPLKEGSIVASAEQKPYQCGSLECGMNTVSHLVDYDGIKAVYLEKHGINILFKSTDDPGKIRDFIFDNVQLGVKVV